MYNGLEENDRGMNFQTYRACFPTIYHSLWYLNGWKVVTSHHRNKSKSYE